MCKRLDKNFYNCLSLHNQHNMKLNIFLVLLVFFLMGCKKLKEEPLKAVILIGRPGAGVTDVDMNTYPTVVFANGQEWMAENLRTTKFNNRENILQIQSNTLWANATAAAFSRTHNLGFKSPLSFYYDTLFGPVYNFYAASDARGLCPTGWRVPSDDDWKALEKQLGMSDALLNTTGWRGDQLMNVADKMMASSDKYEYLPIWEGAGGTNASGLNMISSGWIGEDGSYGATFSQAGFWSQTEDETNVQAWSRRLDAGQLGVERAAIKPQVGYSIRCIKGEGSRAKINNISMTNDVTWVRVHPSYYTIGLTSSIANSGGSEVTEFGYYWGLNSVPTLKDSMRKVAVVNGKYDITINNLQPDKQYFFRAYAKNALGTSYSEVASFYTGPYSSMQDQDSNVYKIKQIGNQVWMCENLRTTKNRDGSNLIVVSTPAAWSENNASNNISFKLGDDFYYNFYTATANKVCPTGWHVPNIDELETLVSTVGWGSKGIEALKTKGTVDWVAPNSEATNTSGFSAQAKGRISLSGELEFDKVYAFFLSTTPGDFDNGVGVFEYARALNIRSNPTSFNTDLYILKRAYGQSIRCIKD